MGPKGALVIVCLCALVITCTDAGIPKCCVTTKKYVPPHMLRKVDRTEMQTNTGACNIAALILHVRDLRKPICAHPKVKAVLESIRRKMKRHANKRNY